MNLTTGSPQGYLVLGYVLLLWMQSSTKLRSFISINIMFQIGSSPVAGLSRGNIKSMIFHPNEMRGSKQN